MLSIQMFDLEKEAAEIASPIDGYPRTNWILVSFVSLVAIVTIALSAWMLGFVSVGLAGSLDTARDDVATADTPAKRIKGNRRTRIYHLPSCPNYDRLAEQNVRLFNTRESALNAGYRLSGNC